MSSRLSKAIARQQVSRNQIGPDGRFVLDDAGRPMPIAASPQPQAIDPAQFVGALLGMGVQPSYEIRLAPDRSQAALFAILGPLRIPLPMGAAEIHSLIDGLTSAAELLIVKADPPVPSSPAEDLLAESIGRIESGAIPFLPAEACCGNDCGDCPETEDSIETGHRLELAS